ncbi:MAG: hypothetical protein HC893_10745 [Chloroflexaceae bacterium]|nr:hypothetical protein [Chloroflexaceae bacterium]NJL34246.1 hypothetical protein [Chloroflexaceae bacterium]NJO07192.1 hypothetical protein [Chloroflexaceae bacterium]
MNDRSEQSSATPRQAFWLVVLLISLIGGASAGAAAWYVGIVLPRALLIGGVVAAGIAIFTAPFWRLLQTTARGEGRSGITKPGTVRPKSMHTTLASIGAALVGAALGGALAAVGLLLLGLSIAVSSVSGLLTFMYVSLFELMLALFRWRAAYPFLKNMMIGLWVGVLLISSLLAVTSFVMNTTEMERATHWPVNWVLVQLISITTGIVVARETDRLLRTPPTK